MVGSLVFAMEVKTQPRSRPLTLVLGATLALLALAVSGCVDPVMPFERDNVVDPGGTAYQGYPTVANADEVSAAVPADQTVVWVPQLVSSELIDAGGYQFQIGAEADFSTLLWDGEADTNRSRPTGIDVTVTSYAWRVRAKTTTDTEWGEWSAPAVFSFSSPVTQTTPLDTGETDTTQPTLTWNEVDGAEEYQIRYATNADSLAGVDELSSGVASVTLGEPLTNLARYYWQVRALREGGVSTAWSTTREFLVNWGAITGQSPADAGEVSSDTPTLSWDTVSGAVSYEIQIASTSTGVSSATVQTTSSRSYTFTEPLPKGATRYWRVRAVDGDGQRGAWTDVIWFATLRMSGIALFTDGSYVHYGSGDSSAEASNLEAYLSANGYTYNTFTGISASEIESGISDRAVVMLPEMETATPTLDAAAAEVYRGFVSDGGTLLVFEKTRNLVNTVFDFSLMTGSEGSASYNASNAAGTPFDGSVATLPSLNATMYLSTSSLPDGSAAIYLYGSSTNLCVIPYGTGRLVYFGWDWYSAAPVGSRGASNWLPVLGQALDAWGSE